MANIRVDLDYTIKDGCSVVFRSPCDCTEITGLIVYYITEAGEQASKEFSLADAHGENVGDIPHLFAENVVVKVILDVSNGMAYVQNADTNAYLEGRFNELLLKEELTAALNEALEQAKESGELDVSFSNFLSLVKLWENASPTSEFASQSIAVDPRAYRFLYIRFRTSADDAYYVDKIVRVASGEYDRVICSHSPSGGFFTGYRHINSCTTANQVQIGNFIGVQRTSATTLAALSSDNVKCIPTHIYGIK